VIGVEVSDRRLRNERVEEGGPDDRRPEEFAEPRLRRIGAGDGRRTDPEQRCGVRVAVDQGASGVRRRERRGENDGVVERLQEVRDELLVERRGVPERGTIRPTEPREVRRDHVVGFRERVEHPAKLAARAGGVDPMEADQVRIVRIARLGVGHVETTPGVRSLGSVEGGFEFARGVPEDAVTDGGGGDAESGSGADASESHARTWDAAVLYCMAAVDPAPAATQSGSGGIPTASPAGNTLGDITAGTNGESVPP
jgi:hypothetical protein